jgi:hypothetical protein
MENRRLMQSRVLRFLTVASRALLESNRRRLGVRHPKPATLIRRHPSPPSLGAGRSLAVAGRGLPHPSGERWGSESRGHAGMAKPAGFDSASLNRTGLYVSRARRAVPF